MSGSQPVDRGQIHAEIDAFLDDVEHRFSAQADPKEREAWARMLLLTLMTLSARIAGNELLAAAYGASGRDTEASDGIALLGSRLRYLEWLFEDVEDEHAPYSIASAIHELEAIAGGDAPRLFSQLAAISGRRTNTYRLALRQAAAFGWEKYLSQMGKSAAQRQAEIQLAFGATWDAIRKWKPVIVATLGPDAIERQMRWATAAASASTGEQQETYPAMLRADGQAYQDELRHMLP